MRHKSSFLRLLTIGAFVVSFTPSVVLAAPYPNGKYSVYIDYDPERLAIGAAGTPGRSNPPYCITFTPLAAPSGYTQIGSWSGGPGGSKGDWKQIGDTIMWYGFNQGGSVYTGTGLVQAATDMSGKYGEYDYKGGPTAAPGGIGNWTGTWTAVKANC
jgi:hypothetical protein